MAHFIKATVADMRGGRESWRVLIALTIPSLAISVGLVVLSRIQ